MQRFEQAAPNAPPKVRRADGYSIDIDHIGDSLVAENAGKLSFVERSKHGEVECRDIGW